jgi:carboxymethylenebutenolidase
MLTIDIPTHDGPMPAFSAAPSEAADSDAAVLVVQEAFGLTDHIGRVVDRLADAGYHAVAPALFHRQGSPVLS